MEKIEISRHWVAHNEPPSLVEVQECLLNMQQVLVLFEETDAATKMHQLYDELVSNMPNDDISSTLLAQVELRCAISGFELHVNAILEDLAPEARFHYWFHTRKGKNDDRTITAINDYKQCLASHQTGDRPKFKFDLEKLENALADPETAKELKHYGKATIHPSDMKSIVMARHTLLEHYVYSEEIDIKEVQGKVVQIMQALEKLELTQARALGRTFQERIDRLERLKTVSSIGVKVKVTANENDTQDSKQQRVARKTVPIVGRDDVTQQVCTHFETDQINSQSFILHTNQSYIPNHCRLSPSFKMTFHC
jgi:hypothetical protein